MSSVPYGLKSIPADARNFMPVSSLLYLGAVNSLNTTTGALSQAAWAVNPVAGTWGSPAGVSVGSRGASTINGPGAGKLRDLGKTYISANRFFRKVQAIIPNTATTSTFGVEGKASTSPAEDYYTGYIEIGWEGNGAPAPVVRTM